MGVQKTGRLDLGHRPIVFIRFNPDDYLDKGNTITSCWSNNKNGICTIKKSKQDEWTQRLNSLTSQLDYCVDPVNKTDKTIETVQLFYDSTFEKSGAKLTSTK